MLASSWLIFAAESVDWIVANDMTPVSMVWQIMWRNFASWKPSLSSTHYWLIDLRHDRKGTPVSAICVLGRRRILSLNFTEQHHISWTVLSITISKAFSWHCELWVVIVTRRHRTRTVVHVGLMWRWDCRSPTDVNAAAAVEWQWQDYLFKCTVGTCYLMLCVCQWDQVPSVLLHSLRDCLCIVQWKLISFRIQTVNSVSYCV